MNYDGTISYLYGLQKHGIKFGLENTASLLSSFGNPHASFRSIHVAGTNGKGSTSSIIASVLQARGRTVGLFTSPHLLSFTERIRINGMQINESEVCALAAEMRDRVSGMEGLSPTFFEVVTVMAMLHFQRNGVDVAVFEVGMGGRLDATNILSPDVTVITRVGLDHSEYLGGTITEIAFEKAGIIKQNIPLVISSQDADAGSVILKMASEKDAPVFSYGADFASELKAAGMRELLFDYRDETLQIRNITLPLAGAHQAENAAIAIKAASIFLNGQISHNPGAASADEAAIREGLRKVEWQGRLQFISEEPPILIDGAHNPNAAEALSRALQSFYAPMFNGIILVLGIMHDKDVRGIMNPLLPLASDVFVAAPAYARSASAARLREEARNLGFPNARAVQSVREAMRLAMEECFEKSQNRDSGNAHSCSPLIVVTGSFYLLGETMEILGQEGILTRLRE